ncbi:MAG: hypothetical protein PHW96_02515 [Candidatus Nanoarchaeia archaeon]|nr:hypothetical protein [Candidatus Nanoarchaeia archaeon]
MLSEYGLFLVVVAWIIQAVSVCNIKKKKPIVVSPYFLMFYAFGVILLVIDSMANNLILVALLNIIAMVLAFLILLKFRK